MLGRIPLFKQRGKIIKAALTELIEETDIAGLSVTITGNTFFDSAELVTGEYIYDPESENYETTTQSLTITGSAQNFIVALNESIEEEEEYWFSSITFFPKESNNQLLKVTMNINGDPNLIKYQTTPSDEIIFDDMFFMADTELTFAIGLDDALKFKIENNRLGMDPAIWPWERFDILYNDNTGNSNTTLHPTIGNGLNQTIRVTDYNRISVFDNFVLNSTSNDSLFGISLIKNDVLIENVFQAYPGTYIQYTPEDALEISDQVIIRTIDTGFYLTTTGSNGGDYANGFQEIRLLDNEENVIRSFPLCNYWQENYTSRYVDGVFFSATPDEIAALSYFEFVPKQYNNFLRGVNVNRLLDDEPVSDSVSQSTNDELVRIAVPAPLDQMLFVFDFFEEEPPA